MDHVVKVDRLRQDANARWGRARFEDAIPEVEVLLNAKDRVAEIPVDPARKSSQIAKEILDSLPQLFGQRIL
ncbi:MAG: hypothetical protein ABIP48_32810 [Planctomycetota bacterium]